jgi:hypothetical protein
MSGPLAAGYVHIVDADLKSYYFKHSPRRPTFRMEDGWIRRRLRSILRKRAGRH